MPVEGGGFVMGWGWEPATNEGVMRAVFGAIGWFAWAGAGFRLMGGPGWRWAAWLVAGAAAAAAIA